MNKKFSWIIESYGYHVIEQSISSSNRAFIVKDVSGCIWFAKIVNYVEALNEQQLLESLKKFDINTPQICHILLCNEESYCLSIYEYIDYRKVTSNYAINIGDYICKLHNALKNIVDVNINVFNFFDYAYNICIPYIRRCSTKIHKYIKKCIGVPFSNICINMAMQLVHGDLHNKNIYLTKNGEVGFFDFENRIKTYRIFDLSYYLVSLISIDINIKIWLNYVEDLLKGYASLSYDEIDLIYESMTCVALMKISFGLKSLHKELIEDAMQQLGFLAKYKEEIINLQKRLICWEKFNL